MLIVLDNLRLDIVQFAVNLQSLITTTFGTIAFHIPHVKRDCLLTTELRLGPVNRYPAHYWHHTILLLTLVHIEQNVKSTSHVSYSFFNLGCKTTISLGIHRYAKCSSLRNKKRAVKGASFFTILKGYFSRSQGHKLGYDLATYLLHQSSQFCVVPIFELPRSSPLCLYFRPKCVNLPKSLRYNNFFS